MREVKSTCPYCGVGCGVLVETRGDGAAAEIVGVRGDPDHPANRGKLCTKGSTLHLTTTREVQIQTRLLAPQMRATRDASMRAVTWDAALDHVADRFADCIRKTDRNRIKRDRLPRNCVLNRHCVRAALAHINPAGNVF